MSRVKGEELGDNTTEDSGVPVEVKEEIQDEEGCIGDAMMDLLRRRDGVVVGTSGYGGLVPGVESLPGGRVPELLGFSEMEIAQVLPGRSTGPFVPYLGEVGVAVGSRIGELQTRGRSRGGVKPRTSGRWRSKRLSMSLSERRRRKRKPMFGSGGPIRVLSNINRAPENRPLQMRGRGDARSEAIVERARKSVSLFGEGHVYRPISWHRQQYDESSEGFAKTGRYHPEDARLKTYGIFDAICEDLELYKIPPADWPESLTFSDFYQSSPSSGHSGSFGKFDLLVSVALCNMTGVWRL